MTSAFYTPTSQTLLAPDTTYWLVAGVKDPDIADGGFDIGITDDPSNAPFALPGWTTGQVETQTGGGSTPWAAFPGSAALLIINVETPVPEPAEYATLGALGLVAYGLIRRARR